MEHLSNDHEDHSSQRENIHKLCDETGQPILSLLESQWKLRQQRQNFPMKGRPLENKYWHQNKEIQKSRTVRVTLGIRIGKLTI